MLKDHVRITMGIPVIKVCTKLYMTQARKAGRQRLRAGPHLPRREYSGPKSQNFNMRSPWQTEALTGPLG